MSKKEDLPISNLPGNHQMPSHCLSSNAPGLRPPMEWMGHPTKYVVHLGSRRGKADRRAAARHEKGHEYLQLTRILRTRGARRAAWGEGGQCDIARPTRASRGRGSGGTSLCRLPGRRSGIAVLNGKQGGKGGTRTMTKGDGTGVVGSVPCCHGDWLGWVGFQSSLGEQSSRSRG